MLRDLSPAYCVSRHRLFILHRHIPARTYTTTMSRKNLGTADLGSIACTSLAGTAHGIQPSSYHVSCRRCTADVPTQSPMATSGKVCCRQGKTHHASLQLVSWRGESSLGEMDLRHVVLQERLQALVISMLMSSEHPKRDATYLQPTRPDSGSE